MTRKPCQVTESQTSEHGGSTEQHTGTSDDAEALAEMTQKPYQVTDSQTSEQGGSTKHMSDDLEELADLIVEISPGQARAVKDGHCIANRAG
jgi:hypothetical protein